MVKISLRMEHITKGRTQGRLFHNKRVSTVQAEDGGYERYLGRNRHINPEKIEDNIHAKESVESCYMDSYMARVRRDLTAHKAANPDDKEIQKRRMINGNKNIAIEFVLQVGQYDNYSRSGHTIPKEDMIKFLKYSYNELKEEFKGQEILSAVIHMDEKTPHLHVVMSHWNEDLKKWNQKANFSNGKTFGHYQDWIAEVGKKFQKEFKLDYQIERGRPKSETGAEHTHFLSHDQVEREKERVFGEIYADEPFYDAEYAKYCHKRAKEQLALDLEDGEVTKEVLIMQYLTYYFSEDRQCGYEFEEKEKERLEGLKEILHKKIYKQCYEAICKEIDFLGIEINKELDLEESKILERKKSIFKIMKENYEKNGTFDFDR